VRRLPLQSFIGRRSRGRRTSPETAERGQRVEHRLATLVAFCHRWICFQREGM
jgi:hypothetical protein